MTTLTFEWRDENNVCRRMDCTHLSPVTSWLEALRKCGWVNRTRLTTVDPRGYVIHNWFDVSGYLPIASTKQNYEDDLAYCKKRWPFN